MRATIKRVTMKLDITTRSRPDTVAKWIEKLAKGVLGEMTWEEDEKYSMPSIDVKGPQKPPSRADRLGIALQQIEDGKSEIESLMEELEDWKGNIEEHGFAEAKVEELDEAIQQLEEGYDGLETAISALESVSFPGMF